MKKRQVRSATAKQCRCGYLERQAKEPSVPIVFDEELNEFHILHVPPSKGYSLIYHCPYCGGAAPRSRRSAMFETLTGAEVRRLQRLTGSIRSVGEAIEKLGPAQREYPHGLTQILPEKKRQAPVATSYRTLHFTQLSETADVTLIDYGSGGVKFSFQGKYRGEAK